MKVLITGVSGFIGAHLARACAARGWKVVGCDSLTDYYPRAHKLRNLASIMGLPGVEVSCLPLEQYVTTTRLRDVDVVFHQAGQPGVRGSWQQGFGEYVTANVIATQTLMERVRESSGTRVVMASSSSVYGNRARYPVTEEQAARPFSPYGVTKLAAERLAVAYAENFAIPVVALRYFTVYGPHQRPDMAMHRLIRSGLDGTPFPLYGSGDQIRDFTFVDDVVDANLRAATAPLSGPEVLNICGGDSVSMREVIAFVEAGIGRRVRLDRRGVAPGDVQQTGGSNDRARAVLGWSPRTDLATGLTAQIHAAAALDAPVAAVA